MAAAALSDRTGLSMIMTEIMYFLFATTCVHDGGVFAG